MDILQNISTLQNYQGHEKQGKTKETVIDQGRLRRHNDQVKCGILNNILE